MRDKLLKITELGYKETAYSHKHRNMPLSLEQTGLLILIYTESNEEINLSTIVSLLTEETEETILRVYEELRVRGLVEPIEEIG